MLFLGMRANAQLVVDLTTGYDNSTSSLITPGQQVDDTWEYWDNTIPGYVPADVTSGYDSWGIQHFPQPQDACGQWISPYVTGSGLTYNGNPSNAAHVYEYRMTFNYSAGCPLTNARIELNSVSADDFIYFELNGTQYIINSTLSNCGGTSAIAVYNNLTVTLNPADILPGTNVLKAFVCSDYKWAGFLICGSLKADYLSDPNLVPSISSAVSFCSGSTITVTGSSATTNVTWHFWEMAQCDASGNIISGGYLWSGFFGGIPGTFTFPVGAPCGSFYKLKLALNNACTPWAETSVIIRYNCSPSPVISGPSEVCYGEPVTYCVSNPTPRTVYTWSNGASGSCTTITPTASTTITVTASNSSGCSGTASMPVTVLNNNPDFNLSTSFNSPYTYYTATATPVVTTGLPAGFGFAWFVVEVDGANNPIAGTDVCNPSAWWSGLSTNFCGYDGFNNSAYNCTGTVNCTATPVGLFVNGHRYRITRATWSTDCGWQQTSKIIYQCHNCRGENTIIVEEDPDAPSYEHYVQSQSAVPAGGQVVNNFTIMPNPNAGTFSIVLDQPVENGTVEIFNMLGEKVEAFGIQQTKTVEMSGTLNKGVYLVRIQSAGETMSQRLVIE